MRKGYNILSDMLRAKANGWRKARHTGLNRSLKHKPARSYAEARAMSPSTKPVR